MKLECDIEEEAFIDAINDIAEGGSHGSGECRGNLSFWNPGEEYRRLMEPLVKLPREREIFDYRYSFTLGRWNELLRAFGVPEDTVTAERAYAVVTPCSSVSVMLVLQTLKALGRTKLSFATPYYYSVRPVSWDLGFTVADRADPDTAVWVTSPRYGTGERLTDDFKRELRRLHDEGAALVFDESLCLPGDELCREFPVDDRTFFIYSPHKAISVNSVKFSAIVCSSDYIDFIDNRQDMYAGALSNSNLEAVGHYLEGNYRGECVPAYLAFVEKRYAEFAAVVAKFPFAELAAGHSGHYHAISTSVPLPDKTGYLKMLTALHAETGLIIYPTDILDFARKGAFVVFRVNLLADRELCIEGTGKVLDWLLRKTNS